MKHIGERVRKNRQNRGMSIARLAVEIKTTTRYVEMIEAGQRIPSLPTLYRLAEALDIDITGLLADDPPGKTAVSAVS